MEKEISKKKKYRRPSRKVTIILTNTPTTKKDWLKTLDKLKREAKILIDLLKHCRENNLDKTCDIIIDLLAQLTIKFVTATVALEYYK